MNGASPSARNNAERKTKGKDMQTQSVENVMALLDFSDEDWDGLPGSVQEKIQRAVSRYEAEAHEEAQYRNTPLTQAAQNVINSADATGCSDDLTVVSKHVVEVLQVAIHHQANLMNAYEKVRLAAEEALGHETECFCETSPTPCLHCLLAHALGNEYLPPKPAGVPGAIEKHTPRIILEIRGGVLQQCTADCPVEIHRIDWDNIRCSGPYELDRQLAPEQADTTIDFDVDLAALHQEAREIVAKGTPCHE